MERRHIRLLNLSHHEGIPNVPGSRKVLVAFVISTSIFLRREIDLKRRERTQFPPDSACHIDPMKRCVVAESVVSW